MKQNLELTKAECRANAVKRMREILSQFGQNPDVLTDGKLWDLFQTFEVVRDECAAEGGYFQREI